MRIWTAGTAGVGLGSLAGGADRVWTAAHPAGQPVVSASQSLTLLDTVKPVLTLPGDVSVADPSATPGPALAGTAGVADAADASPRLFFRDTDIPYPKALLLWYPLDEPVGADYFYEGLNRGRGWRQGPLGSGIAGMAGGAAVFDGGTGRVYLGKCDTLNALSNRFTVAAWVRPDAPQSSAAGVLTALKDGWALEFRSGKAAFTLSGIVACESPVRAQVGRWCHVAASFDENAVVRLYVDGSLVKELATGSPFIPGSGGWAIGGRADGDRSFNGAVDDVTVWDGVLEPESVAALYAAGRAGKAAALADGNGHRFRAVLRHWNAADSAAWISEGAQGICFTDVTAPALSALGDVTVAAPAEPTPDVTGTPQATDNEDPSPAVSFRDFDSALSAKLMLDAGAGLPVFSRTVRSSRLRKPVSAMSRPFLTGCLRGRVPRVSTGPTLMCLLGTRHNWLPFQTCLRCRRGSVPGRACWTSRGSARS